MNLFKLKDIIRQGIKKRLEQIYSLFGYDFIGYSETIDYLEDYVISERQNPSVKIPKLNSFNGVKSSFFDKSRTINFYPDLVWMLNPKKKNESIVVQNSGSVLVNKEKYLRLDFNAGHDLAEFSFSTKVEERPLIVPWSHRWGTYYDYFIFVITKLCRIEQALEQRIWEQSLLYYPFLNTSYEHEILDYFDLKEHQFLNLSKWTNIKVKGQLITGNNQNWYYPRPKEVELLREKFLPQNRNENFTFERIYIVRKGSRAIKNENEVRILLEDFEFRPIVLEDMTLRDQISLFKNAEVVIGPHGAGFTNILWSSPGAHVIEFFSKGYFPPHFYYLSQILNLNYHCIVEGEYQHEDHKNRYNNMTVDIKLLEKLLDKVIRSLE